MSFEIKNQFTDGDIMPSVFNEIHDDLKRYTRNELKRLCKIHNINAWGLRKTYLEILLLPVLFKDYYEATQRKYREQQIKILSKRLKYSGKKRKNAEKRLWKFGIIEDHKFFLYAGG